jgi:8-oxo-dGTP diphosphatase
VSVLIVRDGLVLLIRRGRPPAAGMWDLPGGFLEADEHPADGAAREAQEETGLVIRIEALVGIYMGRYGDPADPESILNVAYLASAPAGEPRLTPEAAGLAWFAPDTLPAVTAFAHNAEALDDWHCGG